MTNGMTETELKEMLGADKLELVETNAASNSELLTRRLQDLILGKIKPTNDVIDYFVNRIRRAKTDWDNVQASIQQANKSLMEAKGVSLELKGKLDSYTEDLLYWDSKVEKE
jgi:hypothetical protein